MSDEDIHALVAKVEFMKERLRRRIRENENTRKCFTVTREAADTVEHHLQRDRCDIRIAAYASVLDDMEREFGS